MVKTFFWVGILLVGFQMLASFKSINEALLAPPVPMPVEYPVRVR